MSEQFNFKVNNVMSRRSALGLFGLGSVALLAGCKSKDAADSGSKKLNIVASFYPMYDFAKKVAGDNADVTCLVPAGTEPHDWEPSTKDMKTIQEADILVYNGAGMEHWVQDVLDGLGKDTKLVAVEASQGIELRKLDEEEGHSHEHSHGKEVSTFEDSEVKDRTLADWEGDWQSAYPLAKDGSLDEAFKEKAESGKMTAEEYKQYYIKGFETDIAKITIKDNNISFTYDSGKTVSSDYKYVGYYIQNWSTGTKGAMYRFEAEDHNSGAPIYVEFNDHMIESAKAEHFHIRMSNESFDAIEDPENRWPTFYPANLTPEQVSEELAAHGKSGHSHSHSHGDTDPHVWLSPVNAIAEMKNICDALVKADSAHKDSYEDNYKKAQANFETLDNDYRKQLEPLPNKTIVVSHEAFGYMCDAYGLEQMPIEGVEADAEPNAQQMKEIADFVKEHNVKTIFSEELVSPKVAQAIADATGAKVRELNPLEGLTDEQLKNGEDYVSVMNDNLKELVDALS